MDRREFIKKGLTAGVAAGAFVYSGHARGLSELSFQDGGYDLIAVRGGEPDVMFDKAIDAFGGIGKIVKRGNRVVVKPNIGWDVVPERAANTNPLLVKRVIEHCLDAGAREVLVFDHTCDDWLRCYSNSGIESAVKDAGGKIVPGNSEKYYQQVEIKGTRKLSEVKVHEIILESDVFINLPVLKHHSGTGLTISMKNLMGIVWDRGFWHSNDLHRCIAEFPLFKKPDLNIVDAYNVLMRRGPRGVTDNDVNNFKSLILSTDIVAADAAAAKIFGSDPEDIDYIKMADELNIGKMDLGSLSIKRIAI